MRNIFIIYVLFLFSGCSSSIEDEEIINNETLQNYIFLKVNGVDANAYGSGNNLFNINNVVKKNDFFSITVNYGQGFEWHYLIIKFTIDGKLISIIQESNSAENGQWKYYNYRNYPSNYFDINILSHDEVSKKINAKLNGFIYLNKNNLNSEKIYLNMDLNCEYTDLSNNNPNYIITQSDTYNFSFEQYCNAAINNMPWKARHEHSNGVFSSVDPYKIEINFANNAQIGSYVVNPTSTINFIKFAKFNTSTLSYDYYNVNGTLAYSYKEFHGNNNYSFIGTFSFVAVNPNNPLEIININNGNFRSFQHY